MAIPPLLGTGMECTFLSLGTSIRCTRTHTLLNKGIRAMVIKTEKRRVVKKTMSE
jgi:hypothetical protein